MDRPRRGCYRDSQTNPRGFGGFRGSDPATHETKRRFSIYTYGVGWPGENPQNPETPEGTTTHATDGRPHPRACVRACPCACAPRAYWGLTATKISGHRARAQVQRQSWRCWGGVGAMTPKMIGSRTLTTALMPTAEVAPLTAASSTITARVTPGCAGTSPTSARASSLVQGCGWVRG
jgi:hypothetical protein